MEIGSSGGSSSSFESSSVSRPEPASSEPAKETAPSAPEAKGDESNLSAEAKAKDAPENSTANSLVEGLTDNFKANHSVIQDAGQMRALPSDSSPRQDPVQKLEGDIARERRENPDKFLPTQDKLKKTGTELLQGVGELGEKVTSRLSWEGKLKASAQLGPAGTGGELGYNSKDGGNTTSKSNVVGFKGLNTGITSETGTDSQGPFQKMSVGLLLGEYETKTQNWYQYNS